MDQPNIELGPNAIRVYEAVQHAAMLHGFQVVRVHIGEVGEDSVHFIKEDPVEVTVYQGTVELTSPHVHQAHMLVDIGLLTETGPRFMRVVPVVVRLYGPSPIEPVYDWRVDLVARWRPSGRRADTWMEIRQSWPTDQLVYEHKVVESIVAVGV